MKILYFSIFKFYFKYYSIIFVPVRLGEDEESRAGWNRLFLRGHVEFGHSSWPGRYSLLRPIVCDNFHENYFTR